MMSIDFSSEQMIHSMKVTDQHIPVLGAEIQQYLNLHPGNCFVDCTIGLGGHSVLLSTQVLPGGRIIGIDRDADSLRLAQENLSSFSGRCDFVRDDFRQLDTILNNLGVEQVDGMLFDLGISSYQLDNPSRGFSLKMDGPLDMRMDQESFLSAYDLINSLSERELAMILRKYGEERLSHRIARFLVAQREKGPLQSTRELCDVVLRAMPAKYHRQKIHPATRTFQAFRIAVNRELESIELALQKAVAYLKVGGRIAVISFHSLEDRIVKHSFRHFAHDKQLRLILKKPLQPTLEERQRNPRSRSARLRVAERL
jgi:16S rRNA (cytosine1402-N4)-methyltransferase